MIIFGYKIERIKLLTCKEKRFLKKLIKILDVDKITISKGLPFNTNIISFNDNKHIIEFSKNDYAFEKIEDHKEYTLKELGL